MSKMNSRSKGRARTGSVLAVGVLTAALSGCTTAPTSATTPTPAVASTAVTSKAANASGSATAARSAPSPSATLSEDQMTLWNRLQEYNAVMNKIMEDPNSDMTKLYTVARDQQAKDDMEAIASARAKGQSQVGDWVFSNPRVDNSDQGKATVTVCSDTMNSQFLDKSGKDIGTHRRVTQAYWLTRDPSTMVWYVTDAEIKAQTC